MFENGRNNKSLDRLLIIYHHRQMYGYVALDKNGGLKKIFKALDLP